MEEFKKVTISFTKDQLEKLDEIMSKEHGYSRSSLVREAVDYYLGHHAQKGSVSYLFMCSALLLYPDTITVNPYNRRTKSQPNNTGSYIRFGRN